MLKISSLICLLLLLELFIGSPVYAGSNKWRSRASIKINTPGIVDTTLLPEMVNANKDNSYDLTLSGPDNLSRDFEMYWRQYAGDARHMLTPSALRFKNNRSIEWEANIPEQIIVDQIGVLLCGKQYAGRLDIQGFGTQGWVQLAQNTTLFNVNSNASHGKIIQIPPNRYSKIRIRLSGHDRQASKKILPIQSVIAYGQAEEKNYTDLTITTQMDIIETPEGMELEIALPGSGLQIESIILKTQSIFSGRYEVGWYEITGGQSDFHRVISDTVAPVNGQTSQLKLDIKHQWKSRKAVVRLYTKKHFIGRVKQVRVVLRVPRLVFYADKPGSYYIVTGLNQNKKIFKYPSVAGRIIDHIHYFSNLKHNPNWRVSPMVEKYNLKGGAFNPAGFTWKSKITIPKPGYYRLHLNPRVALEKNYKNIRLVYDQTQVYFSFDRKEIRKLPLSVKTLYNPKANTSTWEIKLPYVSEYWRNIELEAKGAVTGQIQLFEPKTISTGWQYVNGKVWKNHQHDKAVVNLSLEKADKNRKNLKVVMNHGNSWPINLDKISAYYSAPALLFLAHNSGTYEVYGGNDEAAIAQYDMSIAREKLMSLIPESIKMDIVEPIGARGWYQEWLAILIKTRWGLYIVLGSLSLLVMNLIKRLFPKA